MYRQAAERAADDVHALFDSWMSLGRGLQRSQKPTPTPCGNRSRAWRRSGRTCSRPTYRCTSLKCSQISMSTREQHGLGEHEAARACRTDRAGFDAAAGERAHARAQVAEPGEPSALPACAAASPGGKDSLSAASLAASAMASTPSRNPPRNATRTRARVGSCRGSRSGGWLTAAPTQRQQHHCHGTDIVFSDYIHQTHDLIVVAHHEVRARSFGKGANVSVTEGLATDAGPDGKGIPPGPREPFTNTVPGYRPWSALRDAQRSPQATPRRGSGPDRGDTPGSCARHSASIWRRAVPSARRLR